ncbi:hypothetical protein GCM10029992_24300 [Glycomyces albus]
MFDTIVHMYSLYILDGVLAGGRDLGVDVVTSAVASEGGSPRARWASTASSRSPRAARPA